MEFSLPEYKVLLQKSEYFKAADKFRGEGSGPNSGLVNIEIPGELHVAPGECLDFLKIISSSQINLNRLMQCELNRLVTLADFFAVEEVFCILDMWYFELCTDKAPDYIWQLGLLYTYRHQLVTKRISKLCSIFPEISESFIHTASRKELKTKVRNILRARNYHAIIIVNDCVICKLPISCKPSEQLSSRRGVTVPCCGTFIHSQCIYQFTKHIYCTKCTTSLAEGVPFIECETLHTTMLRMKIRKQNAIPRDAQLPSLIPVYCVYKSTMTNWICEASLCKEPSKPKHMLRGPPVLTKTCE